MSARGARRRALLVSAILPARGGNGLAMRAGVFLEALAADHAVTLLLVPIAGGAGAGSGRGSEGSEESRESGGAGYGAMVSDFVLDRVDQLAVLPLHEALDPLYALSVAVPDPAARLAALRDYPAPLLCRWATSPALAQARRVVGEAGGPFDAVVVLRSHLAPYAAPFLDGGSPGLPGHPGLPGYPPPLRLLDLDDDEQLTHRRLAELHAARGRTDEAVLAAAEAGKYVLHERRWLPRFDRVLAASELHEAAVRRRHPGVEVSVVPNTVEVPDELVARRYRAATAPRLLFVGNLSYEPNVDAALRLAQEVMPLLWRDGVAARLRLAGSAPAAAVAALGAVGASAAVGAGGTGAAVGADGTGAAGNAGDALSNVDAAGALSLTDASEGSLLAGGDIEVYADPLDLAPHYAWADVALAPIRAGGGTRIKILEAFAAGVPVVATTLGAEGLAVHDGEHLLLADEPETLAAACRRLAGDAEPARRLATAAFDLVRRRYARPSGVDAVRGLLTGGGT